VSPLLAITLYMILQFGIGVWVSRRIKTESDYILAGRNLGYGLLTFSIFATWFGAETVVASAGLAYSNGVSLGSAEPFGYGLCLLLMGLVFAGPLWRRKLTTLADLFRERFSVTTERLAAAILIPSSILWGAAQIRAFSYVLTTSSGDITGELAIAIAAGFTILYATFGGLLVDAITDVMQGVILVVGLVIVLIATLPLIDAGEIPRTLADPARAHLLPTGESAWTLLERWAIPVGGSVIATELVGRVIAARTGTIARRAAYFAGTLYIAVGAIPVLMGLVGPRLVPNLADPEQLLPTIALDLLPVGFYAIFAGALIAAILSTVNTTLLVSAALLSHNIIVPVFKLDDERRKVIVARGVVIAFGIIAYFLARHAEGVFALVEQASAFGSAGTLVTVTFGLFTTWGGARTAIATLATGMIVYVAANVASAGTPFLISLGASLACYLIGSFVEPSRPSPALQTSR
jgi:Na+/proline symporter